MHPSAPTSDAPDSQQPGAAESPEPAEPRRHVDDDRIVGGVAAFLAGWLGVDPLWVRVAFVLLTLAGGIGLVLYAGLWLVLRADRGASWRWQRVAGGLLLVLGIPLLLNAQVGRFVTGPVAVVLLLAGLALALWRSPAAIDARPPAPLAPPDPSSGPAAVAPGTAAVTLQESARVRWPRPAPSVLGRAALGLAIAVAAAGALVDEANGGRLHPEQWLGAAAVVCGLGLLVGTFRGHARWLIVPAIAFAGTGYAAGISARLGIEASDTFGERWVYVDEAHRTGFRAAHTAFGSVDVYVDGVPPEPVLVDARVGIGDIEIRASSAVTVEIRPRVDHGDVEVDDSRRPDDEIIRVGREGDAHVVVEAWVGHGDINVETYVRPERFPEVTPEIPPLDAIPPFDEILPGAGAPLRQVGDGVAATTDGWFVLAGGEAIIDPNDRVAVGVPLPRDDGISLIATSFGEFRLLPRSLLITPSGEVLDLQAIRAGLAPDAPDPSPPATDGPTTSSSGD